MLNRRRISGVAMVLAFGLALVVTGCADGNSLLGTDGNGGNVRFVISGGSDAALSANVSAPVDQTDGPAATDGDHESKHFHGYFESANVTFSSVLARNLDGVLLDVADMGLPQTVDVVTLEGGRQIELPPGNLVPGSYDQVVIVMTALQGVTRNGTTITIEPPGGGWTAIVYHCDFTVDEGGPTEVNLVFELNKSFSWRENRYHFKPIFVCASGDDSSSEDDSSSDDSST